MSKLNYKQDLTRKENSISAKTLEENKDIVELIVANINSLYGLLSVLNGSQENIFPINTDERSKRFLVMIYSMSSFHISSSISDHALSGRYPEAAILMRSFIESVGFAEYYYLNPPSHRLLTTDISKLPSRQIVFKYLKKYGKMPLGGPQKSYSRYNESAHADIKSVTTYWAEAKDEPKISLFWIRRYHYESFYKIMRDLLIPLIAIKQIFRETFKLEINKNEDKSWSQYWAIGHDRGRINRLFPEIQLGKT